MISLLPDLLIVEGEIILRGRPVATAILSLKMKRRRINQFISEQTVAAAALGMSTVYGTTIIDSTHYSMPWGISYIWPQWGSGNA